MSYFLHPTAFAEKGSLIGDNTKIWHYAVVRNGAKVGDDCVLGQNVYIAPDAVVGNKVHLQNNVSVFGGVTLEDCVFCGPNVTFTNVKAPRCEYPKKGSYDATLVKRGASIGAGSIIVCKTIIGSYAMIAAGSVVTKDVPDYALVMGSPARFCGWRCRCGSPISVESPVCSCGLKYKFSQNGLCCEKEGA